MRQYHYIGNRPYGKSPRRLPSGGGLIARFQGQSSRHISYTTIAWGGELGGNVAVTIGLISKHLSQAHGPWNLTIRCVRDMRPAKALGRAWRKLVAFQQLSRAEAQDISKAKHA